MTAAVKPEEILKSHWGFDSFRPLQKEIIQSVLDGHDTLALMPTGGGKSLCFQVPALCREGICLVVSPLIALMKDQVQNLQKKNIPAVAVFSGMHYKEIDRILDNCVYGNIKFLYLSPERLTTELAIERIKKMKVNLLAVDEAHCISQWGYDFRPPYLQIAATRELLPHVPVLALTATATPDVVNDIQEKLAFKNGKVFQKSFSRENLAYVVLDEENKQLKMLDILRKVGGSGIVYARNRKLTKETSLFLKEHQISADFYHAGLTSEQRSAKQDAWLNNQIRIMVSTNAFGMGIDKPEVRTVIHLDLPESLEAYFQEAGRAGRDGKKSYAILLYSPTDKSSLEKNVATAYPPLKEIRRVYQALGSYFQLAVGSGQGQSFDFDIADFCNNFKLDILTTFSCLKILEQEAWIALNEAVYLPSTYTFLVSREQLYDFQIRKPKQDLIIKTLLRVTEGAFSNFVPLHENAVAKFLKVKPEDFINALHQLHAERIIDYRPTKEKPQLILLQDRIETENLTINLQQFNFRKERYTQRVEKAIAYATTPRCRSQMLLEYFGETSEPCGVCDVCLGRTKSDLATDEYVRYRNKIALVLKSGAQSESQILEAFAANRHAKVLEAINYLLEEGHLIRKENKLAWKG